MIIINIVLPFTLSLNLSSLIQYDDNINIALKVCNIICFPLGNMTIGNDIWGDLSLNELSAIFEIFKVRAPLYDTKEYLSNDTFLIIYKGIFLKLWSKVLQFFFFFQQLKSKISQIDQNGVNPFCDETLHILFSSWFFSLPRLAFEMLTDSPGLNSDMMSVATSVQESANNRAACRD